MNTFEISNSYLLKKKIDNLLNGMITWKCIEEKRDTLAFHFVSFI